MGSLADSETRQWRIAAHGALDPLWKVHGLERTFIYAQLARALNLPPEETHIAKMDKTLCKEAIKWARQKQREITSGRFTFS